MATSIVRPDSPIAALPAMVNDRCAEDGDRLWLQDVDGGSATFAQARERSGRWAAGLARLHVRPGDRVATLLSNSSESVIAWLGIARVGAIEAPVHPAFSGYLLEHTINTVGAEIVLVEPARLGRVLDSLPRLPTVRHVVVVGEAVGGAIAVADMLGAAQGDPAPDVELSSWDPAAIIFTSGTTGPSKGVVTPWGVVRCTAQRTFPYEDLESDDAFYVFTPASHIGAKALPYLAAMVGGRAILRADFKIGSFLDDIRRFGITTTPAVGAIPHFLDNMAPQPGDADVPLRNMVMAPLVPDLDGFRQRFGVRICTAYSMTELAIPFASEGWNVDNFRSVGRFVTGWPGFEVRLVDEHDYEVAVGEVGELVVRSATPWTLNSGYYNQAEATATAWRNGWFHTGDAFRCDREGYYYFIDRVKDAIRRRGENISSFEVETLVNQHPAVVESAAVAAPADAGEDEVKVFVVVTDDTFNPEDLIRFLIDRMPRFMIPRYVEVVAELPKTQGTLRTLKKELRDRGMSERTWDRQAANVELPAPDGPLAGITVLELAGAGPTPFCGMLLADLGAQVIRIDRPNRERPLGVNPTAILARGRQPICLDLTKPEAVQCALRMVAGSDALIEGFRPGVMERLGLGPDECQARNPALVYGRATGWGQDGALRDNPGHDINFIAVAGALHPIGAAGSPPPPPLSLVGDFGGGGMLLAVGVVAALLRAARTGNGDVIDAAMVDGAALLCTAFYELRSQGLWSDDRGSNLVDGGSPLYGCYETADGRYVAVAAMEAGLFADLAMVLELTADEEAMYDRADRWPQLRSVLEARFRTRTRSEWDDLASEKAVCISPVLSLGEAPDHVHNQSRRVFTGEGSQRVPAPAPRFRSAPAAKADAARRSAAEVLTHFGFGRNEVAELVDCGALIADA